MKRLVVGAVLGLALVPSCATEDDLSTATSASTSVRRHLVVFRQEALPRDAATKISKAGGKLVRKLDQVGIAVFTGTDAAADRLAQDAGVLAVGPEHMFKFSKPAAMKSQSDVPVFDWALGMQWDMRRIGAPALWQRGLPRASSVAVLDTGVMSDHPDIAENFAYGVTTNYCGGSADGYPEFNGIADLTLGECTENWYQRYLDDAFHGTHVAGTIAAPINGEGVVGVSPTTKIAAYNVFDVIWDGYGLGLGAFDEPIFAAIVDATLRGNKVINMSLGGVLDRSTREGNTAWLAWSRVTSWANRKGMLIIAAAGNETTNNNGTTAFIPSDLSGVMSVSATGASLTGNGWIGEEVNPIPGTDVLTFYSNYGAAVDIAAPGGDCGPAFDCGTDLGVQHLILSTCAFAHYDADGQATGLDPYYCWAAGTSMAAPHVAGVAAAARAVRPWMTPGDTRSWLKSTAFKLGNRQGFGAGIVNADAATN